MVMIDVAYLQWQPDFDFFRLACVYTLVGFTLFNIISHISFKITSLIKQTIFYLKCC